MSSRAEGRLVTLALAVLLLVSGACSERGATPPANQNAGFPQDADQVMFGITTVLTNLGVRTAQLKADTAFFYDDNSRVELRGVHLTFYTETGQRNAVLTSREGTYNMRAEHMEARGAVVVQSEDARRLTTEQLRYNQRREEISSDSAFVLTEPDRRVEGIGFVSDPDLRNVRVLQLRGGSGPLDLSNPAGQTRPPVPPGQTRTVPAPEPSP